MKGHDDAVVALLALEAVHPDSKDHFGSTPLSIASRNGHTRVVGLLLATGRINFDSRDCFGRTPLSWARKCGNVEVEQLLLKYAKERGIPVSNTGIPVMSGAISNGSASRWCDICTLRFQERGLQYKCEECLGGDFDVCIECYDAGGHCLTDGHGLVHKRVASVSGLV